MECKYRVGVQFLSDEDGYKTMVLLFNTFPNPQEELAVAQTVARAATVVMAVMEGPAATEVMAVMVQLASQLRFQKMAVRRSLIWE